MPTTHQPNPRIRVLHILAPARQGGLERVVTMLCAGQRRDGVHVAALMSPNEVREHPFIEKLQRIHVPVTTIAVSPRSYLQEYRSLNALVGRLHPTLVHSHGYHADTIGALAARAAGTKIVSTVHGFVGGSLRNRFYERVQLIALRRADAVLAVSAPLVDRLVRARVPRDKVHLVPNGFDPPASNISRAAARKELGIPDDGLIAGWVGRLSPEKGADVMLEAIAGSRDPWRASIIGDGPEHSRLRRHAEELGIADRVSWHGAVDNAGALFKAFDAFILSSRTEGTPIALFEAMNAMVPIVATTVGGVPDVVKSVHAILVPAERPAMIAAGLAAVLDDPTAAMQRSLNARERLLRQFGVDQWIASVDSVYREILP